MTSRFQFTLVLMVFFLVIATMLYGWVYLDNLNAKYTSLLNKPNEASQKIEALQIRTQDLKGQVMDLTAQLENLQVILAQSGGDDELTGEDESAVLSATATPIFIDEKCVENPDALNECAVLKSMLLSDTVRLEVRPQTEISVEGFSEISLEFYENNQKYTEISLLTDRITNTDVPIATVSFISPYDMTVSARHGIDREEKIFTYDGVDWIDYDKYSFGE